MSDVKLFRTTAVAERMSEAYGGSVEPSKAMPQDRGPKRPNGALGGEALHPPLDKTLTMQDL